MTLGKQQKSMHREAVVNRLRERGIRCHRPAKCQLLTDIQYLLRFFFVSVCYNPEIKQRIYVKVSRRFELYLS